MVPKLDSFKFGTFHPGSSRAYVPRCTAVLVSVALRVMSPWRVVDYGARMRQADNQRRDAPEQVPGAASRQDQSSPEEFRVWRGPGRSRWGNPRRPRWAWGIGLALVALFVQLVASTFAGAHQPGTRSLDLLGYGLLAAGPLVLIERRRWPAPVAMAVVAITVCYGLLGYPVGPCFFSPTVAVFVAIQEGKRTVAWITAIAGAIVYALLRVMTGHHLSIVQMAAFAAWMLVLLSVAELVRVGRERALARWSAQREQQRRRESEERLQIAREIHDVLAHHLSMINVQASVALHLTESGTGHSPQQTHDALAAIKIASKDALQELRATLGALRQVDEESPRAPAPGLVRLDDLIAGVQATGILVLLRVDGEAAPLPSTVEPCGVSDRARVAD